MYEPQGKLRQILLREIAGKETVECLTGPADLLPDEFPPVREQLPGSGESLTGAIAPVLFEPRAVPALRAPLNVFSDRTQAERGEVRLKFRVTYDDFGGGKIGTGGH